MCIRTLLLYIFVCFFACSASARSGNCTTKDGSTRPDCPGAIEFFSRVQKALRKNDRQALASMAKYPLRATLHKKSAFIHSRKEFLENFDELFDSGVRCSILSATKEDVWGNWQGFMVGDGAIWFDGVIPPNEKPDVAAPDYWKKYPFKIITINHENYPCDHQN